METLQSQKIKAHLSFGHKSQKYAKIRVTKPHKVAALCFNVEKLPYFLNGILLFETVELVDSS